MEGAAVASRRPGEFEYELHQAQLSVVDGVWQDQPDHIGAFDAPQLGPRGRGSLLVLVDVSGATAGRAELERDLVETLRRSYAEAKGAPAPRLVDAIRGANRHLLELNRAALPEDRRLAGVTLAALRGADLYLAQTGPALAFIYHDRKLQQFPGYSPWLEEDGPAFGPGQTATSPLGAFDELAPDQVRTTVEPGDIIILAMRALANLVTTEELNTGLAEHSVEELAGYFETVVQDTDVAALIVQLALPEEEKEQAPAPEPAPPPEEARPAEPPISPTAAPPRAEEPPPASLQAAPRVEVEPPPPARAAEPPPTRPVIEQAPPPTRRTPELIPPPATPVARKVDSAPAPSAIPPRAERPRPRTVVIVPPAPDQRPPPATASQTTASQTTGPGPAAPAAPPDQIREERRFRREERTAAGRSPLAPAGLFLASVVGAVAGLDKRMARSRTLRTLGTGINRGLNSALAMIGYGLGAVLRVILPGLPERDRPASRRASGQPLWLKAVAIALPLLFVLLAGAMFYQRYQGRQKQFTDLVNQVSQLVEDAKKETDRAVKLEKLNQALDKLAEARKLNENTKTSVLYYDIQDQLNLANGIAVIFVMPTIARYTDAGANPRRIVAHDNDVFVLDRGTQRVYRYVVNEIGTEAKASGDGVFVKTGDKIGERTLGELVDMAWVEPGGNLQTGSLLVVDSAGTLALFDPTDLKKPSAAAADTRNWGADLRAATYSGNLYLLAPTRNQIYRYVPSATGYTLPANNYFAANAGQDLAGAVDMAIDGDIWVLKPDGVVLRFRGGAPSPFAVSGLDGALANPNGLFTALNANSLYLADNGNARVLQFDKTGKFQRQFKPAAQDANTFGALQSLFVDELKRRLYLLSGNTAYMANLPR